MDAHHRFSYVAADIPPGVTIADYRRRRGARPRRRGLRARLRSLLG